MTISEHFTLGELCFSEAAARLGLDNTPTSIVQLQAAISTYQADQQLVLSTALVGDANTQTKIALLSNLIAGTVDAILAVIPSCQASPSPAFKSTPPLSLKNFVVSYNAILIAKTGNFAVDVLTASLKLHQHSKVLRALTFGRLQ
jgi:hypothetical protein